MLDEAEYASDTDESDEDYMPDADGENVASENESDGEPEQALDDENGKTSNSRKRTAPATTPTESKRSRTASGAATSAAVSSTTKSTIEKDELADDDDDENEEALWAKFLENAGQTNTAPKSAQTTVNTQSSSTSNGNSTAKPIKNKAYSTKTPTECIQKKQTVTEIFEFAGEKVEVQKEIKISDEHPTPSAANDAKQVDAKKVASKSTPAITLPSLNRRSGSGGGGSGLSSILGQIGKKNKLSVLEKTKLDWNGFKRNEGIDEELQTHNKGRDGYLERQDFLQRTDLRQFEIEKSMRQSNRRK